MSQAGTSTLRWWFHLGTTSLRALKVDAEQLGCRCGFRSTSDWTHIRLLLTYQHIISRITFPHTWTRTLPALVLYRPPTACVSLSAAVAELYLNCFFESDDDQELHPRLLVELPLTAPCGALSACLSRTGSRGAHVGTGGSGSDVLDLSALQVAPSPVGSSRGLEAWGPLSWSHDLSEQHLASLSSNRFMSRLAILGIVGGRRKLTAAHAAASSARQGVEE